MRPGIRVPLLVVFLLAQRLVLLLTCANQSQKMLDDGQAGSNQLARRASTDKRASSE